MKAVDWKFFLIASLSFCACSKVEKPFGVGNDISVLFSANRTTTGQQVNEDPLSILVFKQTNSGEYTFSPLSDDSGWESSESVFTKRISLPAGVYRFLLAKGYSTEPGASTCLFTAGEKGSGGYDKDYFFCYPVENTNGILKLESCTTDLYADANENGFEPNQTEYSLSEGNRFSVRRKITRLQGRIDFLLRRGQRNADGALIPLQEGPENKDALENALKKILSVQVTAGNVSSRCHLDGLSFSTPGIYPFELAVNDFTAFDSETFTSAFEGVDRTGYSLLEKSAYCKGPLLFPAPGKENIELNIIINYVPPLAPKQLSAGLRLERNRAVLVILWLLNEEVGTEITFGEDELEFENVDATGDDGFWN